MRRVVGPFVLVLGACLAAGCGSSSLQAKARKVVGDPRATVIGTETVEALSGARLEVVVLRPGGSQGLGCVGLGVAYRCPHSDDAYVLFNPRTHADGGSQGISRWQVAAIAKARATSPRFRVFPGVNQLTVRCAVPHAGPSGGTRPGMCATVAMPFGKPVRCVAFSEGWRPNAARKLRTRGWVVRFSPDGRVLSTRENAHPPQPWANGDRRC